MLATNTSKNVDEPVDVLTVGFDETGNEITGGAVALGGITGLPSISIKAKHEGMSEEEAEEQVIEVEEAPEEVEIPIEIEEPETDYVMLAPTQPGLEEKYERPAPTEGKVEKAVELNKSIVMAAILTVILRLIVLLIKERKR